jgi:hypothetical protein
VGGRFRRIVDTLTTQRAADPVKGLTTKTGQTHDSWRH